MNEFFITLEVRVRVETEADMKAAKAIAKRRAAAMRSSPRFRMSVEGRCVMDNYVNGLISGVLIMGILGVWIAYCDRAIRQCLCEATGLPKSGRYSDVLLRILDLQEELAVYRMEEDYEEESQ